MAVARPSQSRPNQSRSTQSRPDQTPAITDFAGLALPPELTRTLAAQGITAPFAIQAVAIPDALAGCNVLGRCRTGSGKTLAFALPVVARLAKSPRAGTRPRPRALILAPTRELAGQIHAVIEPLADAVGLTVATVFGGVSPRPQITALSRGVDIIVACPGRLLDHHRSGRANLGSIEITVIDEADHMSDLGFLPDVRSLLDATPADSQRMLFSATLDRAVNVLVRCYLPDARTHDVDEAHSPVDTMDHHVLHVREDQRLPVIADLASAPGRTIVFTRTKHGAKKLTKALGTAGIPAVELHGNLSQQARSRNLAAFSDGRAMTLVATDVAARGIHVDDVQLVVHADPPTEHKAYLHRSGRTARAGSRGTVVTMMTDGQRKQVATLLRAAKIDARTSRAATGDRVLLRIAPGERVVADQPVIVDTSGPRTEPGRGHSRGSRPARANGGRGRGGRQGRR